MTDTGENTPTRVPYITFRQKVSVPIRDFGSPGAPVIFVVDVYGLNLSDVLVSPGGGSPFRRAVERLGLDPNRYSGSIWEVM